MVYSKRTSKRRRAPSRLRRRRMRIRRPIRSGVHNFTRYVELPNITTSTVSDKLGGETFKLTDLPSYTEFTNLFDKFRICAVKYEIVPNWTSSDINPIGTYQSVPNIFTVLDYNDITTPGSLSELLQYKNLKRTRGHLIHKRYIKPAVLAANYEGAVTTAYTSVWKRWLDTTDSGTLHYGLKYCIDQTSTAMTYRVYAKYYIQCKDPK